MIGRCGIHVFRRRELARLPCAVCAEALELALETPAAPRFVLDQGQARKAAKIRYRRGAVRAVPAPFGRGHA